MKTKLICVLMLIIGFNAQAQNIREADWIASIEQEVRTIHRTQLNIPVVETQSNNLFALEPTTGEILWKYPLKAPVKSLSPIEGTPFSLLDSVTLVDINSGKTIDLTSQIKGKLKSCHLIPESYDLVFYSKDPDYFLVVDLFNFSIRWNMRADFTDKPGQTAKSKFGAAFAQVKDNTNQSQMLGLECPPVSNKAGGLIIAGFGKVSNVDNKGNVIWQVEQPKKKKSGLIKVIDNQTELMIDDNRDQFYILKTKNMMAMKISDGSVVWPEFYEVRGNTIIDTEAGLLPLSVYKDDGTSSGNMFSKSSINLVDPATGKAVWPADLELKGYVDRYRIMPDGNIALVTFNQTNSKFQILDAAKGKFLYPDEVKLKGRVIDFIAGKEKTLFATSKGLDMIESSTGKDLLERMQKFDNDADIFTVFRGPLIYNIDAKNKKVYKTDLTSAVSTEIIRDFKFQANESLVKYDVMDNGNLFLASSHHMQVFSPTGELVLTKPFDYEGRGLDRFNKAMETVDKVGNTMNMVSGLALSGVALGVGSLAGDTREAIAFANTMIAPELATHHLTKNERAAKYYISLKRLDKDTATPGSFFVRRNKEQKANYLSYVSKTDGAIIFDIPLAEDAKDPEFSINEATGYVYYSPKFVNQDKAVYQAMFNKEKLRQAEANNRLGFVAGYKF
jgi:outer membrane protein assembly factor BamB